MARTTVEPGLPSQPRTVCHRDTPCVTLLPQPEPHPWLRFGALDWRWSSAVGCASHPAKNRSGGATTAAGHSRSGRFRCGGLRHEARIVAGVPFRNQLQHGARVPPGGDAGITGAHHRRASGSTCGAAECPVSTCFVVAKLKPFLKKVFVPGWFNPSPG